ncbi:MAG: GTP cyclohydrolase I FolE [Planctomycetes bacterium]|nr:GTP cyclohydrolase I FolE [Planctomycetota bacterium]
MNRYEDEPLIDDDCIDTRADVEGVVDVGAVKPGDNISCLVKGMLRSIGENPEREGLQKTPYRVDAAIKYLTKGYNENLDDIVNDAIFKTTSDGIVLVKDIDFCSLCEHHMLPFFGKLHIAYLPAGKVLGISKLPRIAEIFARRLQIQENMTQQIADAIESVIKPKGVAIICEATHMCMMMRGVQKVGSTTVTRTVKGAFKNDEHLRAEVFRMIGQ